MAQLDSELHQGYDDLEVQQIDARLRNVTAKPLDLAALERRRLVQAGGGCVQASRSGNVRCGPSPTFQPAAFVEFDWLCT